MNTDIQSVTVKYQTQQIYCSCCNQKLPKVKTSKAKEYVLSKDDVVSWTDWNSAAEYPEDMDSLVQEFVYDTVRFYAVDSSGKMIVEDSEIEKVKEFILREVVADREETA